MIVFYIFLGVIGTALLLIIIGILIYLYRIGLAVVIFGIIIFIIAKFVSCDGEIKSGRWGVKYERAESNGAKICMLYSPSNVGNQIQIIAMKNGNKSEMFARFVHTMGNTSIRWSADGIHYYPIDKKPLSVDLVLNTYKNNGFIYYYDDTFFKFPNTNFTKALEQFYRCYDTHIKT